MMLTIYLLHLVLLVQVINSSDAHAHFDSGNNIPVGKSDVQNSKVIKAETSELGYEDVHNYDEDSIQDNQAFTTDSSPQILTQNLRRNKLLRLLKQNSDKMYSDQSHDLNYMDVDDMVVSDYPNRQLKRYRFGGREERLRESIARYMLKARNQKARNEDGIDTLRGKRYLYASRYSDGDMGYRSGMDDGLGVGHGTVLGAGTEVNVGIGRNVGEDTEYGTGLVTDLRADSGRDSDLEVSVEDGQANAIGIDTPEGSYVGVGQGWSADMGDRTERGFGHHRLIGVNNRALVGRGDRLGTGISRAVERSGETKEMRPSVKRIFNNLFSNQGLYSPKTYRAAKRFEPLTQDNGETTRQEKLKNLHDILHPSALMATRLNLEDDTPITRVSEQGLFRSSAIKEGHSGLRTVTGHVQEAKREKRKSEKIHSSEATPEYFDAGSFEANSATAGRRYLRNPAKFNDSNSLSQTAGISERFLMDEEFDDPMATEINGTASMIATRFHIDSLAQGKDAQKVVFNENQSPSLASKNEDDASKGSDTNQESTSAEQPQDDQATESSSSTQPAKDNIMEDVTSNVEESNGSVMGQIRKFGLRNMNDIDKTISRLTNMEILDSEKYGLRYMVPSEIMGFGQSNTNSVGRRLHASPGEATSSNFKIVGSETSEEARPHKHATNAMIMNASPQNGFGIRARSWKDGNEDHENNDNIGIGTRNMDSGRPFHVGFGGYGKAFKTADEGVKYEYSLPNFGNMRNGSPGSTFGQGILNTNKSALNQLNNTGTDMLRILSGLPEDIMDDDVQNNGKLVDVRNYFQDNVRRINDKLDGNSQGIPVFYDAIKSDVSQTSGQSKGRASDGTEKSQTQVPRRIISTVVPEYVSASVNALRTGISKASDDGNGSNSISRVGNATGESNGTSGVRSKERSQLTQSVKDTPGDGPRSMYWINTGLRAYGMEESGKNVGGNSNSDMEGSGIGVLTDPPLEDTLINKIKTAANVLSYMDGTIREDLESFGISNTGRLVGIPGISAVNQARGEEPGSYILSDYVGMRKGTFKHLRNDQAEEMKARKKTLWRKPKGRLLEAKFSSRHNDTGYRDSLSAQVETPRSTDATKLEWPEDADRVGLKIGQYGDTKMTPMRRGKNRRRGNLLHGGTRDYDADTSADYLPDYQYGDEMNSPNFEDWSSGPTAEETLKSSVLFERRKKQQQRRRRRKNLVMNQNSYLSEPGKRGTYVNFNCVIGGPDDKRCLIWSWPYDTRYTEEGVGYLTFGNGTMRSVGPKEIRRKSGGIYGLIREIYGNRNTGPEVSMAYGL